MSAPVYEFVVTGRIGPNLRSRLADLEIEDRPPHTRLTLRHCDQATLLCAIEGIAAGAAEIETIRSGPVDPAPIAAEIPPQHTPVLLDADGIDPISPPGRKTR